MPLTCADLKPIRPFQSSVPLTEADPAFLKWKEQYSSHLSVEIGCGQGLHPIRWAQAHPKQAMVAIERTQTKFHKALGRWNKHSLPNLFLVHQEAQSWIPVHLGPSSVDTFYLLYPNPYPKESQANKRWQRNPFMAKLLETLKPSGRIELASNLPWFVDEAKLYMQNYWNLQLEQEERVDQVQGFEPRTHFEKKYIERQEPCTHLTFRKINLGD
jgi:tRNA (guanine-N7-)-methyltransferase